jgi:hypothetical protein
MKLSDFDDADRFERITPDVKRPNYTTFLHSGPVMMRVYREKKTGRIFHVSPDPGEYCIKPGDGTSILQWTKFDA